MNATAADRRPTAADGRAPGAGDHAAAVDQLLRRARIDAETLADALAADDALGVHAAADRMAATAMRVAAYAVAMRA